MGGRAGYGWKACAALAFAFAALAGCRPGPARSAQLASCQAPAWSKQALERRIGHCTELIATARSDELTAALTARAEAYQLEADLPAALNDYARALRRDPHDAAALNGQGMIYLDQGDLARAQADLDQAVRFHPDAWAGYNNRGVLELRRGDFVQSLRDENRAIELDPASADPWANRGLVFLARRRWDLALADFADALHRDRRLTLAMDGAGQAYLGKGDQARAARTFGLAADADFDAGRYPAAIAEAGKALAAKPDDAHLLNMRCWSRAIENVDLAAALADCERSLQVRPDNADTLDSVAFVRFRMGDYRAAIAGYDAALRRNPKLASSRFMLGVAEICAGDRSAGRYDVAAADDMDGSIAAQFAAFGVTPASGGSSAGLKTQSHQ